MNKFAEIQNFGINALTTVFIITLIFTLLTAYAFFKQNKKIVRDRSGISVSFILFCHCGFGGIGVTIYGIYKNSLALTINGCAGFIALAIVINLLRFKKISLKEKIIGFGIIILLPLILWIKQKDLLYFISGLAFNLIILIQILEIWKNKSSGEIHPGQIVVNLLSAIFWSIYAFIMGIWAIEISGPTGVILWTILLITYLKFKSKPTNLSSQSS